MSRKQSNAPSPLQKLRCAVYTRKSSEEGLEMEFNSLEAQRESSEAYIVSQRAEGWLLVPDRYDDGGFSGGTLDRPALKRLLADIEAGKVDIVVVYKIDRLSRSLMNFFPAGRGIRRAQGHVYFGDTVLQYHDVDGSADTEYPALLCAVRTRGDRRAHPGQVRGLPQAGDVDGRLGPSRLRGQRPEAGRQ
jgi:hypothetical protein